MESKRLDLTITVAIGLFAAANSYTHVYALARQLGQDELSAALLWFTVDGLILVGVRNMRTTWLGHLALWLGIAGTAAANVASGLSHDVPGAIVGLWPAAAFLLCAEIALRKTAPETAPASVPESAPEGAPEPPPAPAPRAVASALVNAPDALEELRQEALRGALPSKRAIKDRVGVGWNKAVLIHDELSALAPA